MSLTKLYNQFISYLYKQGMYHIFLTPKNQIMYKHKLSDMKLKPIAIALSTTLLLGANTQAQQCSNFKLNNSSNPLKGMAVLSGQESRPFFVDIDGDGNLDCFAGEYNTKGNATAKIYFYKNEGTNVHPSYTKVSGAENPFEDVAIPVVSIPYFLDIDNDGDNDCFIGDGNTGAIRFYKNIGTATKPQFEKQSAAMNPLSMVKLSAEIMAEPAFADVDNDGDQDCLITDLYGNQNYYKNTGTAKEPSFEHITGKENPFSFINELEGNGPSFYDWNKDGLQDLFIGTKYYKNTGTKTQPAYTLSQDGPSFASESYLLPLRWVNLSSKTAVSVVYGGAAGNFNFQTTAPEISVSPNTPQTISKGSAITLRAQNVAGYNYQWTKDGQPVAGANKSELMVKDAGAYSVEVTSACGNIASAAVPVALKGSGVDDIAASNNDLIKVQAYPNPTKDEFTVTIPAGVKASSIRVIDLQGRKVFTQTISSGSVKFGKQLNTGIYFLQLVNADAVIHQQKLVKN